MYFELTKSKLYEFPAWRVKITARFIPEDEEDIDSCLPSSHRNVLIEKMRASEPIAQISGILACGDICTTPEQVEDTLSYLSSPSGAFDATETAHMACLALLASIPKILKTDDFAGFLSGPPVEAFFVIEEFNALPGIDVNRMLSRLQFELHGLVSFEGKMLTAYQFFDHQISTDEERAAMRARLDGYGKACAEFGMQGSVPFRTSRLRSQAPRKLKGLVYSGGIDATDLLYTGEINPTDATIYVTEICGSGYWDVIRKLSDFPRFTEFVDLDQWSKLQDAPREKQIPTGIDGIF